LILYQSSIDSVSFLDRKRQTYTHTRAETDVQADPQRYKQADSHAECCSFLKEYSEIISQILFPNPFA